MQTFCKVANFYTSRLRLILKLCKNHFSFTGYLLNIAYSLCIIYTTCFQCGTTAKTNNVQHYCSNDKESFVKEYKNNENDNDAAGNKRR